MFVLLQDGRVRLTSAFLSLDSPSIQTKFFLLQKEIGVQKGPAGSMFVAHGRRMEDDEEVQIFWGNEWKWTEKQGRIKNGQVERVWFGTFRYKGTVRQEWKG